MSEKSKQVVSEADKFSGKQNGTTWEKFDEKVVSWGRLKFGEKYARALWRDELLSLKDLNLAEDLDKYNFDEHCALVNDVIAHESPKYADSLLKDKRFTTLKWQVDCRIRFREKLFCFLETICKGEAYRQLQKRGVNQMSTMREYFFRRFGAGQPEIVKERERVYLLGMPNASGEVFPPRCNIEDKLDALEAERDYLLDMCPRDKIDTYEPGKETTLVRILQLTLPEEYDQAMKTVMDLVRVRKASESGGLDTITNLEDNVRKNYSIDWLPPYKELRTELINTWQLAERRRKESGRKIKGGHPVLPILQGHDQPGPEQRPCYGCGQRGDHIRGDPRCPAGPDAIWEGAPAVWRDRIQNRGGRARNAPKGKGKGKGKGKPSPRHLGKRNARDDAPKESCPNWGRGNGFCKYGPNCRLSHDGPKGGAKKQKNQLVFLTTKKGKKARKKLTSLVVRDIKDSLAKNNDQSKDGRDEDTSLYRLIRGVPTGIILRGEETKVDFVPKNPKSFREEFNSDDEAIYNEESSGNESMTSVEGVGEKHTHFTVTLMISAREKSNSDSESSSFGYSPKRLEKSNDNSSEDSSSESSSDSTENFIHSESKIEETRKIKNKNNSNDDLAVEPNLTNKMELPIFEETPNLGIKSKQQIGSEILFPEAEQSSEKNNDATRNLGLRSDTWENRALFFENQARAWKSRAEEADKRVERLQVYQNNNEIRRNLKVDNMERKLNNISKSRELVFHSEIPTKSKEDLKVRRWDFRSKLEEQTKPKWASEMIKLEDDWIVIQIPNGNESYMNVDFVDGDTEDEKEWLEGPFDQSTTIKDLINIRDQGREARRLRSRRLRVNEGRSVGRVKSTTRKPRPAPETLFRSIAPGSRESWNPESPWPEKTWYKYLDEKERRESVSKKVERVKERDLSPRNNFRDKEAWIESFRGKVDTSSPTITPGDIIDGEKRRLKRLRGSSTEMRNESSSADVVGNTSGRNQWDLYAELREDVSIKGNQDLGSMKLAMRQKQIPSTSKSILPVFKVGDEVTFEDYDYHIRGDGKVTKVILPGEKGNRFPESLPPSNKIGSFNFPEVLYEIDTIAEDVKGRRGWIRESKIKMRHQTATSLPVILATALHPMDHVGIDTCSAVSVSTERADFVYLDESQEAKDSVSLNGVGAGGPEVVGRGPMIVSAIDTYGNQIFMLDPAGVLIKSSDDQAKLRIIGQQRMKRFGFTIVQDYATDEDRLIYRDDIHIRLTTINGILMMKTVPWGLDSAELANLERMVEDRQDKNLDYFCILLSETLEHHDECDKESHNLPVLYEKGTNQPVFDLPVLYEEETYQPVLIINEAKLTKIEMERVDHWRHAHRSSDGSRFKERCHTCEQAKHKSIYKRNEFFQGTTMTTNKPYWRIYSDAYGGQRSMGCESYQGGIGGFVFVCPVSGRIKAKLYSSQDQYPSVLYQTLQEVEGEGYVCRELYCDTSAVNISAAVEEVAGMFKLRVVPISGGTPQELAYAESAVRTLGQMSRSLMIGAPHLPQMMWGLSDLYAAYIHSTLPQKGKGGLSPLEITTGRPPDRNLLFIHVFGCPCQYEPANDVDHKRAAKTEWGWFVGLQWPMVLILRPFDNKVLSISRKKVHCHEMMYARFDAETQTRPVIDFKDFKLDKEEVDEAIQQAITSDNEPVANPDLNKVVSAVPDHVLSVKVLSDAKRNQNLNAPSLSENIPPALKSFNLPQHDPGENCEVPEPLRMNKDLLLEEIKQFKARLGERNLTEKIIAALKEVEDNVTNQAPGKQSMPKKKKFTDGDVSASNISLGKRTRNPKMKNVARRSKSKSIKLDVKVHVRSLKVGDRVKILTSCFGVEYAKGKAKYTYGKILSFKGDKVAEVLWESKEGKPEAMISHLSHLRRVSPVLRIVDRIMSRAKAFKWPVRHAESLFPILEVGSQLTETDINANGNWPKDFIEALIRPDWRSWVEAVKSENESWETFEATVEIPYKDIVKGASVIPLGELFTIKRSGKYKFRQIALGNLLKEGKDYGETFASTVSGDGLRWFCSLAVTCGKEIRGWDATTGYLQTVQRVPVYAYLPSHHGYSNLEYEELAKLRAKLIEVLKAEGINGIKEFSKRLRRERRIRPDTVLELKRSVYGIPDAGQSFSMFMQSLHLKKCGMVQSDMDPCLFYKIIEGDKDEHGNGGLVIDYLIAITWVDDCRYFGTRKLVEEYEKLVSAHCKCTMEGVSKEFVSILFRHDMEKGTLELTQEEYWVKAVARFKEFLPVSGPKIRQVPLSPADERLLVEPTEEEIKAGEHLPFPNVLGVVQYPSNFTKLEMRYSMSVLSRHRTKWGITHFRILLKALEYGWSSRMMGIKYNANMDLKNRNVLIAYADASFTVPRSQGCRIVVMNGAAISFSSKRHTTTDDSTTASELTEAYLCSCDVEGV